MALEVSHVIADNWAFGILFRDILQLLKDPDKALQPVQAPTYKHIVLKQYEDTISKKGQEALTFWPWA